ncbi:MAG: VOC family protein [Pyrinomonadaceae bacterium]
MSNHGEFCWYELGTNDLDSCLDFYSGVFGWEIKKSDNPDTGMDYREIKLGGGDFFGGMYQMSKEMFGETLPPSSWINYIAVEDVDAAGKKVKELGGKLVSHFIDIPNVGRMCVAEDPTGAKFALITLTH